MFTYKEAQFKKHEGDYVATINKISELQNKNGDGTHLKIYFQCFEQNGTEFEREMERIIFPTVGDKGLFDQLLAALEILPDLGGGEMDEKDFEGKSIILSIKQTEYTSKKDGSLRTFDDIAQIKKFERVGQVKSGNKIIPGIGVKPTKQAVQTSITKSNGDDLPF